MRPMRRTLALALILGLVLAAPVASQEPVPVETRTVTVTTDASGDATTTTTWIVRGRIVYVWYQDGFDDTADLTITCNRTAEGLWTESNVTAAKVVAPTKAVQDQVGVDRAQFDYVWCIGSAVKVVVAQGGATKSAVFEVAWF